MQIQLFHGYPDLIGRRSCFAGSGIGPKAYVTGGDPVTTGQFGYYIDSLEGNGYSVTGTYYTIPIPSAAAVRATWKLKWIVTATNVEVANGVDLSAEKIIVSGLGGVY
jgi:hypothetical protein